MDVIILKKKSQGRVTTGSPVTIMAGTARTVMPAGSLLSPVI